MVASPRGTLTLRREDGRIIGDTVQVADTTTRRMRGLLGRGRLGPGEGLLLRPAWSIHTAFMRFPIDVVFIDQDLIVLRIESAMGSFKTASCRGAREVVELAAGECERRGLEVGDRVAWASWSHGEEVSGPAGAQQRLEARGQVVIASVDQRFAKLARFLLDGRGIGVTTQVRPDELVAALEDTTIDAILLDAGNGLGAALRYSNAVRASRPDLPVVIVGDGAAERAPAGVAVYDKWEQIDEAIDALDSGIKGSREP